MSDVNVMVLVKGGENYIWLFRDEQTADALRTLGRFAADDRLDFTWYDAAVMSRKMRERTQAKTE